MSVEGNEIRPPRRVRKSIGEKLREALIAIADGHGSILDHKEEPWASITFTGARHSLQLAFNGSEAIEAGESFVAALPDHEFAIPGQLVADATVSEVEHTLLPEPCMVVWCELLLLVDA